MRVEFLRRYARSPKPGVTRVYEPGVQDVPDDDAEAALACCAARRVMGRPRKAKRAPANKAMSAPENKGE